MNRYIVGQRVRVRGIEWYSKYLQNNVPVEIIRLGFNEDMAAFLGRYVTICEIEEKEKYYRIKEAKRWVWHEEMFEKEETYGVE